MKPALIIFLLALAVILGFRVLSLQKELLSAKKNAAFYQKRNDKLQREFMRVNRLYGEKERFLEEIKQSIGDLEGKMQLETLERYIPKKTWIEIKPVIDRLKRFQDTW